MATTVVGGFVQAKEMILRVARKARKTTRGLACRARVNTLNDDLGVESFGMRRRGICFHQTVSSFFVDVFAAMSLSMTSK